MYKRFSRNYLILTILSIFSLLGQAQNELSSPYSSFGVGVLNNRSNGINSTMGGVGYALRNSNNVNFKNPASYVIFDSLSLTADVAFSAFSSTLTTNSITQKNSRAQFDYLAIGIPINSRWATSVGILPFSELGYDISDSVNVQNVGTANYRYAGEGGLMQLYWGNGFKLTENLSIGLNLSYLWGNLNSLKFMEFNNVTIYNSKISEATNVDGLHYTLGLQYKFKIKEDHQFMLGLVYENGAFVKTRDNLLITNYKGGYEYTSTFDTIVIQMGDEAVKGQMKFPQFIGGGLSYSFKDKYLFSSDVTWQNWENFSGTTRKDSLKNNIVSSLGFQYIPDSKSSNYLRKVNYRAGVRYSTGYMVVKDTPISDFTFSIGAGFPLKTFNTRSSLNIMLEYGKMGTKTNDLIDESYMRLSFNFILHEKWYQRVKLD
jgi:hypothetical protein